MRYARWILTVVLLSVLMSFMRKDEQSKGLNVGNVAPNFSFVSQSDEKEKSELSDFRGKYVLLSFWASYDADSRMMNATLCHALRMSSADVAMISVSFDKYRSIFEETVRRDRINAQTCFVDTKGETSRIYKRYRLEEGFTNYLLDSEGTIVAKNLSASQLSSLLSENALQRN